MKKFLKDNVLLIIGGSLPIIVIIIFLLSVNLPKLWVKPPAYDFLYSINTYYNTPQKRNNIHIENNNGLLEIWSEGIDTNNQITKLFIYEAKMGTSREIPIPMGQAPSQISNQTLGQLSGQTAEQSNSTQTSNPSNPSNQNSKQRIPINVPEIQNLHLNNSTTAPDGYQIQVPTSYSGLNTMFFDNSNKKALYVLSKDGYRILVKSPILDTNYYGQQPQFLGWIIPMENIGR